MLRICRQCATQYEGDPGSTLCPACVKLNKQTTIRERICRGCGITFPGGPRAWYCPDCRIERRRAQSREYHRRGAIRPIGSEDLCPICGKPYTVAAGTQRYCPDCAPAAVREIDRAQSRKWQEENVTPAQRMTLRKAQAGELVCRICGQAFVPRDASQTCSRRCSSDLARQSKRRWEQEHRMERNAYRRNLREKKLKSMTSEELAERRGEVNARARENYRKRKEKQNND